ncbi:hypothetical protein EGT07_21880 [Herbaspirillum sp. HC18]|nr:hypothetical protein EGT07_21880 [Herbaspirillum sp. HC18]
MHACATDPILSPLMQETLAVVSAADDMAGLRQASRHIHGVVHGLVEKAHSAESLTFMISLLNDALTRRVIEVVSAGTCLDGIRWCWISLGSEGRQEQTLSSDQDNGIIFACDEPAEDARTKLLPLAERINAALDDCGFPLCTGQVMAGNPQWCLSLHEWKERFRNWIMEGDPLALLNASIFFDFRPLHGDRALAEELAAWLADEASANRRFLFQMAINALHREIPLGLIRRFVVEKKGKYRGMIDLKISAASVFVDAARIYGLSCGTHASNTAERLRLAVEARRLHPDDVGKWIEAFDFIQLLRLKNQHLGFQRGQEMHNHVDPWKLDSAERRKLLLALRQARALHHRLALDYPGSQSAY